MARNFNGTSDRITTSIGLTNFVFGPGTVAAMYMQTSDLGGAVFETLVQCGSTTAARVQIGMNGTSLFLQTNNVAVRTGGTVLVTDGWVLAVITKDTGSVAGQLSLYKYLTRTWILTASALSGTTANSTAGATSCYLGADQTGSSNWLPGSIEIAAVWDVVLTLAQINSLVDPTVATWNATAPKALWRFDQGSVATPLPDSTGNGADQTAIAGTAVTPDFSFGVANPDYSMFPPKLPVTF